jgi:DNA (cytosine-5)-methyltransferase 1
MAQTARKPSHNAWDDELRDRLTALARRGDTSGADVVRAGASYGASIVATDLDAHWRAAREDGPIDVIDMFSGCGGMSAGFRAVNGLVPAFRLAAAVDIDKVANGSYRANLGLTPMAESVAVLAKSAKLRERLTEARRPGHPLILIGCAPCQGFSSHRNAAGQQDVRNALLADFARVALHLQPEAIVVENVPEILTNRYWPLITEVRARLEKAGYFVHLGVHNAAEFGVPQERFRAVLLAMRRPFRAPRGFLTRAHFRTVRQSIGDLPPVSPGLRDPSDPMHFSADHRATTLDVIRAVPKDGGNRPAHLGPECLRRAHERLGKAIYEDVYGRLYWDRPSITITAYARNPASGRFVHPAQDRGLTVREAALLQGFPSTYAISGSFDEQFRQIGNAVPARFAAALAMHLLGELVALPPVEFERGMVAPVGASFSRMIAGIKSASATR